VWLISESPIHSSSYSTLSKSSWSETRSIRMNTTSIYFAKNGNTKRENMTFSVCPSFDFPFFPSLCSLKWPHRYSSRSFLSLFPLNNCWNMMSWTAIDCVFAVSMVSLCSCPLTVTLSMNCSAFLFLQKVLQSLPFLSFPSLYLDRIRFEALCHSVP